MFSVQKPRKKYIPRRHCTKKKYYKKGYFSSRRKHKSYGSFKMQERMNRKPVNLWWHKNKYWSDKILIIMNNSTLTINSSIFINNIENHNKS